MQTETEIKLCPQKTEKAKPTLVCFVCTGNTCRSPMAAAVLNSLGKGSYKAISSGTAAIQGDMISANAVTALENAGIVNTPENNYRNHRAQQANAELLERCDKIVAITKRHMLELIYAFPELTEKITVMSENIPDPFMCGEETYSRCLEKITKCIKEMFCL